MGHLLYGRCPNDIRSYSERVIYALRHIKERISYLRGDISLNGEIPDGKMVLTCYVCLRSMLREIAQIEMKVCLITAQVASVIFCENANSLPVGGLRAKPVYSQ